MTQKESWRTCTDYNAHICWDVKCSVTTDCIETFEISPRFSKCYSL